MGAKRRKTKGKPEICAGSGARRAARRRRARRRSRPVPAEPGRPAGRTKPRKTDQDQ